MTPAAYAALGKHARGARWHDLHIRVVLTRKGDEKMDATLDVTVDRAIDVVVGVLSSVEG
jgi:hypothetical protein